MRKILSQKEEKERQKNKKKNIKHKNYDICEKYY